MPSPRPATSTRELPVVRRPPCVDHGEILPAQVRASHAAGTGTMQLFIERPSAESMADWISILVPSAPNVGC